MSPKSPSKQKSTSNKKPDLPWMEDNEENRKKFLKNRAMFTKALELKKEGMSLNTAVKEAEQIAKVAKEAAEKPQRTKVTKVAKEAAEKARQRTTLKLPGSTQKGGKRRKPRKTKKHRKKKSL